MFGRKKQPTPSRQRPAATPERRNAAVFSYHAARSVERTRDARDPRSQQQASVHGAAAERREAHSGGIRRSITVIVLVILGMLLLSSLFLGTNPRVVFDGSAAGQVFLRSSAEYQQAAAAILRSSPFNRTKPSINAVEIAAQLQRSFPELEAVRVSLPLVGYQPVIHVQAATPAIIMGTASGQAYILATDGRALVPPSAAPRASSLDLPVVTDQSGLAIHPGTVALPGSTVSYITEVVGQLRAAHLVVASLTLPKGTSELDVRLDGVAYAVKFNLMGQAREEAGAFLATKAQLERQHISPGAYVDVRVDGRAYFK
ncbi:MAG TPA: hypothetical protein VLF71_04045 [Candidatus Saccharimonadales bacterium]|nr:hypothetical protein [Candidatus Saccharimonadales bacterium]